MSPAQLVSIVLAILGALFLTFSVLSLLRTMCGHLSARLDDWMASRRGISQATIYFGPSVLGDIGLILFGSGLLALAFVI